MGYVECLLKVELDEHHKELARWTWSYKLKHEVSMLKTISELEYVLEWLKTDETYQKY